jgi:hypothetical protein
MLHHANALSPNEVWEARQRAKDELVALVLARTGQTLRSDVFTLGFARRATAYKRSNLVLSDLARLRSIARTRPLRLVFAGKAHPKVDWEKPASPLSPRRQASSRTTYASGSHTHRRCSSPHSARWLPVSFSSPRASCFGARSHEVDNRSSSPSSEPPQPAWASAACSSPEGG